MKNLKTFFIRTYGCQMNELDSEIMATQLINRGLVPLDSEDADLIIFNTCSVRDLAERKVLGKLGQLLRGKKKNIIGIAGCMAMAKKEDLLKKFPKLDFIIGTNSLSQLNNILDEVLTSKKQVAKLDDGYEKELEYLFAKRENKLKAYISIIRGCNNFCTYCIVPHTRGRELSRPQESIISEALYLRDKGYKEITLLGQNVNSYGKDKKNNYLFHDLLYDLNKIEGIERIRFLTSHPKDITINLMEAIRDLEKVCEFVHFPMQSGSNKILQKMNRKYTRESYLAQVYKLKEIVPNVAIGTDIIVGFPTETDEDFNETYEIFKELRFNLAYIFAYSPRKNTLAYTYEDDVAKEIKKERLHLLMKLYETQLIEELNKLIGSTQSVLVERFNKDNMYLKGKTKRWEKVIFEGTEKLIGTTQDIKIKSVNNQTLIGSIA